MNLWRHKHVEQEVVFDLIYFALIIEMGIESDKLFQTFHNVNIKNY